MNTLTPISLDERLKELETSLIRWALEATHGNKSKAAALLRVKRSTLGDRIRHCGLDRREINDTPRTTDMPLPSPDLRDSAHR